MKLGSDDNFHNLDRNKGKKVENDNAKCKLFSCDPSLLLSFLLLLIRGKSVNIFSIVYSIYLLDGIFGLCVLSDRMDSL